MSELNNERKHSGLGAIGYGIGLHVGNVMFGNVGLRDRLSFSTFGSAVNEVQRLQELTKKYPHNIIASEAFSGYAGGSWTTLGQEKLRGVQEAITIHAPDLSKVAAGTDESAFEPSYDGLSDAENVMLLHRDARNPEREQALKKMLQ